MNIYIPLISLLLVSRYYYTDLAVLAAAAYSTYSLLHSLTSAIPPPIHTDVRTGLSMTACHVLDKASHRKLRTHVHG